MKFSPFSLVRDRGAGANRRSRKRRRLLSEALEPRRLLAADIPGDRLDDASPITLTVGQLHAVSQSIGDGVHGGADVDLYRVQLAAGQTLHADVDAYYDDAGNRISDLDSYLRIFDDNGDDVTEGSTDDSYDSYSYRYGYAQSPNDYGWGYADDYVAFTAPATGVYYVGVSNQSNTAYDPMVAGSGNVGTWASTGDYILQLTAEAAPVPELTIADATAGEGDAAIVFDVTLSMAGQSTITVDYLITDTTTGGATDYEGLPGTIVFAPGVMHQTISVPLVNDDRMEDDETLIVTLQNSVGAPIEVAQAVGTIVDDDPDLVGDHLASATPVALVVNHPIERSARIGDGIHGGADVDLYRVQLAAGQTLHADVDAYYDDAGNRISDLDSYLRIFDDNGDDVTEGSTDDSYDSYSYRYGYAQSPNDYGWGYADDYVAFTAPSTGVYYVGVSNQSNTAYDPMVAGSGDVGGWASTGDYVLQLTAEAHRCPS